MLAFVEDNVLQFFGGAIVRARCSSSSKTSKSFVPRTRIDRHIFSAFFVPFAIAGANHPDITLTRSLHLPIWMELVVWF